MASIRTTDALDADERRAVSDLLGRQQGQEWADQLLADLDTPRPGVAYAVQTGRDGEIVGFAQASPVGPRAWQVGVVPEESADRAGALLDAVGAAVGRPATLTWWTHHRDASLAAAIAGFEPGRGLLRMEVTLPLAHVPASAGSITLRPFRPGADDAAWLEVNNAAFAAHAEQGHWDQSTLDQRIAEPWFDPDGFLLLPGDASGCGIDGFCWTKVHDGRIGEIYVIGVHPAAHGRGLGTALTAAGLAHLSGRGITRGMLYLDEDNHPARAVYERLGFTVVDRQQAFIADRPEVLPTWSVADVHESLQARSFTDAMDGLRGRVERLIALFDEHGIRGVVPRPVTDAERAATRAVLDAYNDTLTSARPLRATVHSYVAADSGDERAQALATELEALDARTAVVQARLAEWGASLGVDALAAGGDDVIADHRGPLTRLAARAEHQMAETDESLYAELRLTGSAAWSRLHSDITSRLEVTVELPGGARRLPIAAVRGLATDADAAVRIAAYDAELAAWAGIAPTCAAALNAIKGEADVVNRRRGWADPVDASLFANSVSRQAFEAMHEVVTGFLPTMRRWMRAKATMLAGTGGLAWWDLLAPAPGDAALTWDEGVEGVRRAFGAYSPQLSGLLDRALDERWIDAAPRPGKAGGAFCMPFTADRSLVLLNWAGSADSANTTAHELGHAYHNTRLAHRTPLQRQLPMALAETASIFCETLMVEHGIATATDDRRRLALLDVDLGGVNQVIVDIRSRYLFESELYRRRRRASLGVEELNEMMHAAQVEAYGDGLDQRTAHPYMWAVKHHYYGSAFYNWPYTFGLLFGVGLYSAYQTDPHRFAEVYDEALSRVGMETAEAIAAMFGFDITDGAFWERSVGVIGARIEDYERLTGST